MFGLLEILLIFCGGVYVVITLLILGGLYRLKPGGNNDIVSVSIIIPARNEAEKIEACLASVAEQDYPKDRFEVIVVDDESEDDTYQVAKSFLEKQEGLNYRVIGLSGGNPEASLEKDAPPGGGVMSPATELVGKKRALNRGIHASSWEILLFTDADCRVPPGWIRTVVSHLEPSIDLVAGFTFRQPRDSLWSRLYSLESLATSTIAAGSIGWGYPITGSASNLAYRRKLFDELGGYDDISSKASGDDTLFLQKAYRKRGIKSSYMASPDSFVTTEVPTALRQIVPERQRRFAATLVFSPPLLSLSAFVLLFYLLVFISPLGIFLAPRFFLFGLFSLGAKFLVDLLILHKSTGLFGKRYLLKYLPVLELVYPPFFLCCAIAALVVPTEWKGRRS